MDDLKYWIWLSSLPGIGAYRFKLLLDHFGSAENVWNANERELRKLRGIGSSIWAILNHSFRKNLDSDMYKIEKSGIKVIRIIDKEYPAMLKEIHDPPPILFVRGNLRIEDQKAIAIVGARNVTHQGMNIARELAYELASRGITIVSGMARGTDTFAHRGALEARGRTIAVLGCGVDVAYPPENRDLISRVSESGAVISEFTLGTKPFSANFPARNRIISGLSAGIVVIEAGEKSGALITADFALEQGREVFAVPGNPQTISSKGTNRLIKEGAKMITCVEDIIEEFKDFDLDRVKTSKKNRELLENLSEDETKIIGNINVEPVHMDEIIFKTGFDTKKLNSMLTILEMRGILKQLPGKFFIRA